MRMGTSLVVQCLVKNPPSKARDVGLIPGPGTKIPHTVTREPAQRQPACHNC